MTAFDLNPGTNRFEQCVGSALDSKSRSQLILCLAKYRVIPKRNPWQTTGYGKTVAYFQGIGNESADISDGVRDLMVSLLGIDDESDIEAVREEIKDHPDWGKQA